MSFREKLTEEVVQDTVQDQRSPTQEEEDGDEGQKHVGSSSSPVHLWVLTWWSKRKVRQEKNLSSFNLNVGNNKGFSCGVLVIDSACKKASISVPINIARALFNRIGDKI